MRNPESFPTYPDSILKTLRKELNYIMDTTHTRILHWHDVTKELPTKNGRYLIFCGDDHRIRIRCFDKESNQFLDIDTTHWMELPKPPNVQ